MKLPIINLNMQDKDNPADMSGFQMRNHICFHCRKSNTLFSMNSCAGCHESFCDDHLKNINTPNLKLCEKCNNCRLEFSQTGAVKISRRVAPKYLRKLGPEGVMNYKNVQLPLSYVGYDGKSYDVPLPFPRLYPRHRSFFYKTDINLGHYKDFLISKMMIPEYLIECILFQQTLFGVLYNNSLLGKGSTRIDPQKNWQVYVLYILSSTIEFAKNIPCAYWRFKAGAIMISAGGQEKQFIEIDFEYKWYLTYPVPGQHQGDIDLATGRLSGNIEFVHKSPLELEKIFYTCILRAAVPDRWMQAYLQERDKILLEELKLAYLYEYKELKRQEIKPDELSEHKIADSIVRAREEHHDLNRMFDLVDIQNSYRDLKHLPQSEVSLDQLYPGSTNSTSFPANLYSHTGKAPFPFEFILISDDNFRLNLDALLNNMSDRDGLITANKQIYDIKVDEVYRVRNSKDYIDSAMPFPVKSETFHMPAISKELKKAVSLINEDMCQMKNFLNRFHLHIVPSGGSVFDGLTEIDDESSFPFQVWRDSAGQFWVFAWHGTRYAREIIRDGFLQTYAGTNAGKRYGGGLYFSTQPSKCLNYTNIARHSGAKAELFLCAVNLGRNPGFVGIHSSEYTQEHCTSTIVLPGLGTTNPNIEIMTYQQCPILLHMKVHRSYRDHFEI